MTVPHVSAGEVARAAEQNALIDAVNTHTTTIDDAATALAEHDRRIATLEDSPSGPAAGLYYGEWTDNNGKGNGQQIDTNPGERVLEIGVPVGTPSGCGMSNGTLTVDYAGLWLITVSLQYTSGTSVRALWLSKSAASSGEGLPKFGAIAGPSMDSQSVTVVTRMIAGGVISPYAAVWQSGEPVRIWRALSNNLTAAWLGP